MTQPRVVLVMPVRNEAHDIEDVLASLEAQSLPHDRLYFLAVDGESQDETKALLQGWFASSTIRGEVLTNPRRTIPTSLNLGIAHASIEDIIVRLDGHTIYGPDYLKELVEALESAPEDVACSGGPQRPIADDAFSHRVVATLYSNRFGLGGSEHRISTASRFVSQVYLGVWRPGILQKLGGFDERWRANEDSEICARMLEAGYRILWLPVQSHYRINRGMWRTIVQWGGYGYWRAQTLRRHPSIARPRHYIAPIGVIIAVLLLCTPLRIALPFFYFIYILLVWLKRDTAEAFEVTAMSFLFLPACQVAWACGVIRGTCSPMPLTQKPAQA